MLSEEVKLPDLPRFSYSKLNTYVTCPMKYKLKYVDGNYDQSDAIHLDIGNISHKVLEIKYRNIIDEIPVDYNYLKEVFFNGIAEETEKDKGNFLIGINAIKDKFGHETFTEVNSKSNLSYDDKIITFTEYIHTDDIGDDWQPLAVELPFEFVYQDRVILHGFIDRVVVNNKWYLRVVDSKSSNKVFEDKDLTTPLQMFIYDLACEDIFGKRPIEHIYDMILLGEKQYACTKGYYNRGIKKLDKILNNIFDSEITGEYLPKPTPLCHWCEFSETNPNTAFYLQGLCDYYSLWTPENKTFKTNKDYIPDNLFDF